MSVEEKYTWFFDVCDTLYRSNTTFDFLQYFFQKKAPEKLNSLKQIGSRKTLQYWARAIKFRVFNSDPYKRAAIQLLAEFPVSEVNDEAANFVKEQLSTCAIAETNALLLQEIKKGNHPILISNSIEPVVKAIAEQYNLKYFATTLQIIDDRYTGRIEVDLMGIKHQCLTEYQDHKIAVVTDNRSDRKLIEMANKPYVVIHQERDKAFWSPIAPTFISV